MKIITGHIRIKHFGSIPIRYIVKEECEKVIAITDQSVQFVFVNTIENNYPYLFLSGMPKDIANRLKMQTTYKAVATLHPSDTWDEKEGLKIAAQKLKEKLEKALQSRKNLLKHYLHKIAQAL